MTIEIMSYDDEHYSDDTVHYLNDAEFGNDHNGDINDHIGATIEKDQW